MFEIFVPKEDPERDPRYEPIEHYIKAEQPFTVSGGTIVHYAGERSTVTEGSTDEATQEEASAVQVNTAAAPKRSRKKSNAYKCQICDATFSLRALFKHCSLVHSIGAEDVRPYQCETCMARFKMSSTLWNHRKTHATTFTCPTCKVTVQSKGAFSNHMKQQHPKSQDYKCETCARSFVYKSYLNAHIKRIHLKQKNFSCKVCMKEFFTKQELTRHEGAFLQRCKKCNLKTNMRCAYRLHVKSCEGYPNANLLQ